MTMPHLDGPTVKISNGATTAEINLANGQLFSLVRDGKELMWRGGAPEPARPKSGWQNSEIIMFPIVGAAAGGRISIDGKPYPMAQHGIARDLSWESTWTWNRITLVQQYDAGSTVERRDASGKNVTDAGGNDVVSSYPRSYILTKSYSIGEDGKLRIRIEIENLSDEPMDYAMGWHPAFVAPDAGTITPSADGGTTLSLNQVRATNMHVVAADVSDTITYRIAGAVLKLKHNFGRAQFWDEGKGYVALEPITAPSLSRLGDGPEIDLSSVGYRTLLRGQKETFEAEIEVQAAAD